MIKAALLIVATASAIGIRNDAFQFDAMPADEGRVVRRPRVISEEERLRLEEVARLAREEFIKALSIEAEEEAAEEAPEDADEVESSPDELGSSDSQPVGNDEVSNNDGVQELLDSDL